MKTKEVEQYWYFVRCHNLGEKAEYDLVFKSRSEMVKYVEELRKVWMFVAAGRVDYSL